MPALRVDGERKRRVAAWGALLVCVQALACSGPFDIPSCGEIPANGCPLDRGGTCDDGACAALYECGVDDNWSQTKTCPGFSSGGGGQGGSGAAGGAGVGGDSGCNGVTLSHPDETVGCQPGLQLPDCPPAAASACRPCETGCIDFFFCTSQGWQPAAFCNEDGDVVLEP